MTGVALLVVAWSFIADLIFQTNRWLDYLGRRSARFGESWRPRYPVEGVASTSAIILAEAAVLWVILTQVKEPFWIRTGATSLVMCVVVAALALTAHTDAAPHEDFQSFWLFSMSVVLAVLCLASGVAEIIKRVRRARSG